MEQAKVVWFRVHQFLYIVESIPRCLLADSSLHALVIIELHRAFLGLCCLTYTVPLAADLQSKLCVMMYSGGDHQGFYILFHLPMP